jgi:formylglycine-generating enzyme
LLAINPIMQKAEPPLFVTPFSEMTKASDVTGTGLLEALCLFPDRNNQAGGLFWGMKEGEKLPIRGGYWVNREMAGVFACGFYMDRDSKYYDVGFRACYYE